MIALASWKTGTWTIHTHHDVMNQALKKRLARLNTLLTGVVSGMVLPVLIYFIVYYAAVRDIGSTLWSNRQIAGNVFPIIISHCVIPDLILFMIFNWLDWLQAAKGVLASTVFMTLFLFGLKLILSLF